METASQIALRNCCKEVREEPGYIGVFAKKKKQKKKPKKQPPKNQIVRTSKD